LFFRYIPPLLSCLLKWLLANLWMIYLAYLVEDYLRFGIRLITVFWSFGLVIALTVNGVVKHGCDS
jgi:hypothetical protein